MADQRAVAGAIASAARHIDTARSTLNSTLSSTTSQAIGEVTNWQGSAKTAFVTLIESWQSSGDKVVAELENFRSHLVSTDQQNTANEDAVEASIKKITSSQLDFGALS